MPVAATTLDWYGCATFRLRTAGLTVFLDAYIDRVAGAAGPGARAADVDRADWIVVGHSHFDHLWGAETIAKHTGATIIGSHETVRVMEAQGVPLAQLIAVSGGERVRLSPDVTVQVFPSQHSCVWSQKEMLDADTVCVGDLGVTWQEREQRMAELVGWFGTLGDAVMAHLMASHQGARGDGSSLVYLLETPEGSLFYQDTSGHWTGILRDLRPDVAILAAAGRGNVDGEPVQGTLAQFVAGQAALLQPKRVVFCHHDDWLPGFSIATNVAPICSELAREAPGVELLEMGYLQAVPIFAGLT
jgi:L-ascorbate metabolism protein UlaG (beta-lactamase superfamily)